MASLPEIAPMSLVITSGVIVLFHLGRGSHFPLIPFVYSKWDCSFIPPLTLVTGAAYSLRTIYNKRNELFIPCGTLLFARAAYHME